MVDFLMEDITTYDDAQVGAAARVVHDGCKAVLCRNTLQSGPCAKNARDQLLPSPWGMQPMNTDLSARLAGQGRFRERLSIAAGKRSR